MLPLALTLFCVYICNKKYCNGQGKEEIHFNKNVNFSKDNYSGTLSERWHPIKRGNDIHNLFLREGRGVFSWIIIHLIISVKNFVYQRPLVVKLNMTPPPHYFSQEWKNQVIFNDSY